MRKPNAEHLDTELLRSVSRSFFLTLNALPATLREPLGHAYLLARLTDTVADSSSAPPTIRLALLEQLAMAIRGKGAAGIAHGALEDLAVGVASPAERVLLQRGATLAETITKFPPDVLEPMRSMLCTIIEGQAGDIQRFEAADALDAGVMALPDAASLDAYTWQVAGCVGEFWTRLCIRRIPHFARRSAEEMVADGILYGKALQLVNILRDLPTDLARGRCYLPSDELAAAGLTPQQVAGNPRAASAVFARWLNTAHLHLEAARRYADAIRPRRLKFATALPADLATATLALFRAEPPEAPLKIGRQALRRIVLRRLLLTIAGQ